MPLFRFFLERYWPLRLWLFVPACLLLAASCSTIDPGKGASVSGSSQPGTVEVTPEIMAMLEAKLIRKMKAPKRYDKPKEAQQFFVEKRAPLGQATFDSQLLVQGAAQADLLPQYSIARRTSLPSRSAMPFSRFGERNLGAWSYHGPGNIGGRTRALLIHPETPEIMFAAGVAGGVWKSADAGTSWTPLTDLLANIAVNSMAMSPHDPDTIYAGTGEGYFNIDFVRGVGIFKSTDGGANWTHLSATATLDFYYVNKIVVSPNNASTVYAATRTGLWRSTDGGGAWTKVLNTSTAPWYQRSGCLDLVVRTDQNPDVLVTAAGNTFDSTPGAIYRSSDGGNNWTQAHTETGLGRCSLAVAPSDQNYIYALAASQESGDYQDGMFAVLRSTDGGATWTARMRNTDPVKLNTLLLSNPVYAFYSTCFGGAANYWYNQGWYDNVIAVDPLDRDKVWAGGVDLFRSDDGGQNWGFASAWWANPSYAVYAHADQHAIVFHPDYDGTTNQKMYVGSDGGLYRTDNARGLTQSNVCGPSSGGSYVGWTSLNNGFGVTQFYHGTAFPGGLKYMGGTQDNGTLSGVSGGPDSWIEINGGDGGYTALNPLNTNILYSENTALSLQKSTDGGVNFADATTGITESSSNYMFIAPFAMAPSEPDQLWIGGKSLWRTINAAVTWTQASAVLPGAGKLTAVSVNPEDPDHVVAGMSDGYIVNNSAALSTGSGSAWPSCRPVSGWISSFAFDPDNGQNVYATCSNFGQPHVLKSIDGGGSWSDISNDLPDVPVHSVTVDPDDPSRIFLGADLGVFVSTNGGTNWSRSNDQFANVITEHVEVEQTSNRLFAFTHGRGVYSVSLGGNEPEDNPVLAPILHLLLGE